MIRPGSRLVCPEVREGPPILKSQEKQRPRHGVLKPGRKGLIVMQLLKNTVWEILNHTPITGLHLEP